MIRTLLSIAVATALWAVPAHAGGNTETYATNVDGAGTYLRWDRYTPTFGGPTWPTVLVMHGGGYKTGSRGPYFVAQDLQAAGFLALAADYRLAPTHTTMPQQVDPPSDGRPPQQTTDMQTAIRAARADSQCNGQVAIVGFSAGASHGSWWSLIGTGSDKPDALVGCSGVYDDDNSDLLSIPQDLSDITNYINMAHGNPAFDATAKAASPYWLTATGSMPPFLMFNSTAETIPVSVFNNMVAKMTALGGTVESHLRTGTEHASDYWYLSYGGMFPTVKACTIDFLDRMFGISPTPTPHGNGILILKKK